MNKYIEARTSKILELPKSIEIVKKGFPQLVDIHPVMNACNLSCRWCIGANNMPSKPIFMDVDNMNQCLTDIFDYSHKSEWPSEVHFCGNNSEPLLNDSVVEFGIKYLNNIGINTMLVTNGLLINANNVNGLCYANTISVSIDALNNKEYRKKKCVRGEYIDPYDRVLQNILLLKEASIKKSTNILISASFVISDSEDISNDFDKCINELQAVGVELIKIRFDARRDCREYYENVRKKINVYDKKYANIKVVAGFSDETRQDNDFRECLAPYIWPTIAANMKMYLCAHSASEQYKYFWDLKRNGYYEFYEMLHTQKNSIMVERIGCNRKCPPLIGVANVMQRCGEK